MLESILYFLLGFLAAGLLALMISPAIWNRAVQLTRERIESSVPLTLNEIQADKDQLRAEFAMSTRRLEISVEDLQDKASRQIIDINRKRDELNKLAEESAEKVRAIEVLESTAADLRNTLREREEQLEGVSSRLVETQSRLEEKILEFSATQQELHAIKGEADSRRIELVAKETNIGNLQGDLNNYKQQSKDLAEETNNLKHELAEQSKLLESANKARQEEKDRHSLLQEQLKDAQDALERSEQETTRLRQEAGDNGETTSKLSEENTNLQARTVELESKLADANLQMEKLLNDASNENVKKALVTLEREGLTNSAPLKAMKEERDDLKQQVAALKRGNDSGWDDERRESAILRERINDLAAQITSMTAALEGKNSPIHDILEQKLDEKRKSGKTKGKANSAGGDAMTLADRIRALQEAANEAKGA